MVLISESVLTISSRCVITSISIVNDESDESDESDEREGSGGSRKNVSDEDRKPREESNKQ